MSERLWEWGYNWGVKVEDDGIVWYTLPNVYGSDSGCVQTFEHFLANGPWYPDVPPEIVEKLTAAVRERVTPSKPAKAKKSPTAAATNRKTARGS